MRELQTILALPIDLVIDTTSHFRTVKIAHGNRTQTINKTDKRLPLQLLMLFLKR